MTSPAAALPAPEGADENTSLSGLLGRGLSAISNTLWILGTSALVILYPIGLGILEDRFLKDLKPSE
jgi:hypothetical protein